MHRSTPRGGGSGPLTVTSGGWLLPGKPTHSNKKHAWPGGRLRAGKTTTTREHADPGGGGASSDLAQTGIMTSDGLASTVESLDVETDLNPLL